MSSSSGNLQETNFAYQISSFLEKNYIHAVIKSCFADNERLDSVNPSDAKSSKRTFAERCFTFLWCFCGLMVSYLIWGVLQEKIMTREYVGLDGKTKAFFKDSQFLVFANRFLAFIIASIYLIYKQIREQQSRNHAPLFKFSYVSLSNIMSAWFQYEALKFVSFPTQVLAKSFKIIPVMIMGRIIQRIKHEYYEYVVAVAISIGMMFFLYGSHDQGKHSPSTTLVGFVLLILYLVSDSFTANYQQKIFKSYKVTSAQMMFGVNLFSSMFTAASLFVQSGFGEGISFASQYPDFRYDCLTLSISAAIGQLFIFHTIDRFGAVTFTIIMTLRQAVAIIISCVLYDHKISPLGIVGVIIVFAASFLKMYSSHRIKDLRRKHELLKQRLNV